MDELGTVLLVDDEETFRESTCRLLNRKGYQCHCAASGDEAIKVLQERHFDLMVADIRMPGNPDLRVVRAARELAREMAVVLVTGYSSTDTAIGAIELGVAAYLTKPLDADKLIGHLKSATERSRDRRALAVVCERLQTCMADLRRVSDAPRPCDKRGEAVSLGTIRTLAACLSELLEFCNRSGAAWVSQNLCVLLDCPQQPFHRQAIVETIEVLKQTKDVFKSKALADLRATLERLLGANDNASSPH